MSHNLTFAQRFALTIAIVLAILFALALFGFMTGGWDDADAAQSSVQMPPISKYEKEFIELDRRAISEAYQAQIHHVFLIWAKDEQGQPQRALVGAKQARNMYERSMTAIDEREARLRTGGP